MAIFLLGSWAMLDRDRKGRYETIHMEAKARYEEEMKSYKGGVRGVLNKCRSQVFGPFCLQSTTDF